MDFHFSNHALEQIEARNLDEYLLMETLYNPAEIVEEDGLAVYHAIHVQNGKNYLYRVYVDDSVEPNRVVTAYKTSKIDKYLNSDLPF
jgi:hypothetical protein